MRKIFKQEIATDGKDNTSVAEIKDIVTKELNYPDPTPFQSVVMSTWFNLASWGLLALAVIVMVISAMGANGVAVWAVLLAIIFAGAGIIGLFMAGFQKGKYSRLIAGCVQDKQELIYKLWFEKNYDDIRVTGNINGSALHELAIANRGVGIPGDARITKFEAGYQLKGKNDSIIEVATVTWRWVRSNGKSSTTYYRKKVYMAVYGFKDSFKDFQFSMSRNGILNKKRTELENEQFNKTWIYNHNDPVKLRMMLTPSVQEDALNNIENATFEMSKHGNLFLVSQEIPMANSTFTINTRGKVNWRSKEAVADNIVGDVIADIADLQKWIVEVSVFRTLFKTI